MAKGMKARGLKGGNGNFASDIDWKAINDQVEEGTQGARISVIVDLGMHKEGMMFSNKGQTGFLDEESAEQWIEEMRKKYSNSDYFKKKEEEVIDADEVEIGKYTKTLVLEDDGTWTVVEDDPEFIVEANEFGGEREYQELAIYADLTENEVDYGGEIGTKPYRIAINGRWQGEIKGFPLKKSKPTQKDGYWTVKSNTKLAELASATGHKELLECDLEDADWSEMLGEAFNITIEKSGDDGQYINVGKCVALKKKKGELEHVEDLQQEPVLITFDDVTADDLEAAHIRGECIKKIKAATDYEGSDIQAAIEEFEKRQKAKAKDRKGSKDDADEGDEDEEQDTKKSRRVAKVKDEGKAETKTRRTKTKPKDDEGEDEGDNEEQDSGENNDEQWD